MLVALLGIRSGEQDLHPKNTAHGLSGSTASVPNGSEVSSTSARLLQRQSRAQT